MRPRSTFPQHHQPDRCDAGRAEPMPESETAAMALNLYRPGAKPGTPLLRMLLTAHDEGAADAGAGSDGAGDAGGDSAGDGKDDAGDAGADDKDADTDTGDAGKDDDLGDKGKKALEQVRAEKKAEAAKRRDAEQRAKAAEDALARAQGKLQEFEDRDKTDLEKAQTAAERAQAVADAARREVATTRIELAAQALDFEDVSDAIDALSGDLGKFVVDGVVDSDAIKAAVEELLEKKPHWKKRPVVEPAGEKKPPRQTPPPKPDPGQGSKGGGPDVDFRKASREDVAAELKKYHVKL